MGIFYLPHCILQLSLLSGRRGTKEKQKNKKEENIRMSTHKWKYVCILATQTALWCICSDRATRKWLKKKKQQKDQSEHPLSFDVKSFGRRFPFSVSLFSPLIARVFFLPFLPVWRRKRTHTPLHREFIWETPPAGLSGIINKGQMCSLRNYTHMNFSLTC